MQRAGKCLLCGEDGHYKTECPRNPQRIAAVPRLPTDPAALAAAQRREGAASVAVDVVPLLRDALLAQSRPHTVSYLCGERSAAALALAAVLGSTPKHSPCQHRLPDASPFPNPCCTHFLCFSTQNSTTKTQTKTAYAAHAARSLALDSGWGCGYRNLQMQAAALLAAARPEARAALFGGCGYVPDIRERALWGQAFWHLALLLFPSRLCLFNISN